MGQLSNSPLRTQINRLLKQAEEEMNQDSCPECGGDLEDGECTVCGYGSESDESYDFGEDNDKESMGDGGMDGMTVTASAVSGPQVQKLASALRYASANFHNIIDDRSPAEKLASLQAFMATARKLAADELGAGASEMSSQGVMSNTLEEDTLQGMEQTEPSRGKKMVPNQTPVSAMGELATNATDDRTGEEWVEDPLKSKRASAVLRRVLRKHAQDPGAEAAAPAPAPEAAPPAPEAGAAAAPPPMAAPPEPPPGPDPLLVAQYLAAQGALTPEALAGAAGISPEEAAAVIAQMTGGTGAPAAPAAPGAAMAPPPPAPEGGAAAPGEAGGMTVQASANPAALFQMALRKIAGEDVSPANISAPKENSKPWEKTIPTPNLPGSQALASNEAAIAFKAQDGRRPRDEAISAVLSASVPYKAESGKQTDAYITDSMIGDKTSSLKQATAKAFLRKLNAGGKRPS